MYADARERIRAVESGLLHPIRVVGRPTVPMLLRDRMVQFGVPGVSVCVMRDGDIDWAEGFGVVEAGRHDAITRETRFQAASISKPVTAVAALRLVEDGQLALEEDVSTYLTSWRIPDNEHTRQEKVTLRRLLSHTAGLTVHGFPGYAPGVVVPTTREILDGKPAANTDPVRVDTPPGSTQRYSGGGYTVVQQLMEDVTGAPFVELMRELVLKPAGMTHSTFEQPLPDRLRPVSASGHRRDGTVVPGKYHTYPEMAAAGLWTTPSDLARFAIQVSRANVGLSEVMTREMLSPVIAAYGLGFGLNGAAFGHGGANEGFRCDLFMAMDGGRGAVIMTSGDRGDELISEVRRSIATVHDWPDRRVEERSPVVIDAAIYLDYAGVYQSDEEPRGSTRVFVRDDALFVEVADYGEYELHPEGETSFFIAEFGSRMVFHIGEDGIPTELEPIGHPFRHERRSRVR